MNSDFVRAIFDGMSQNFWVSVLVGGILLILFGKFLKAYFKVLVVLIFTVGLVFFAVYWGRGHSGNDLEKTSWRQRS